MLDANQWLTVLERMLPKHEALQIHLFGAPGDRVYLERIATLIREHFPLCSVSNEAGRPLREAVLLLSSMSKLFCIDSALLHFARLLRVPTIAFWGPTDPRTRLRGLADSLDITYYQKLSCSPCVHMADRPPCRGRNVCISRAVASCTEVVEWTGAVQERSKLPYDVQLPYLPVYVHESRTGLSDSQLV